MNTSRTLETLKSEVVGEGVDAVCLQEADEECSPYGKLFETADLEAATGLRSIHTEVNRRYSAHSTGFLGTIVMLHPRITVEDVRLVDMAGVYPRGAVIVDATLAGSPFRLVVTHLSLAQALRAFQLRTIAQHLVRCEPRQTVLCGDLNEWRPWGGLAFSPAILGDRFTGPAPATFPVQWPFLPLDRVLATAPADVEKVEVLDGPLIQMASDHRPIRARVKLA